MIDFKKLRAAKGLSQSDLAKILGVATKSLFNYEKGDTSITLNQLAILADYFGLSPAQLLEKFNKGSKLETSENEEISDRLSRIEKTLEVVKSKTDFLYVLQSRTLAYDKLAELEKNIKQLEDIKPGTE